MHSDRICNPGPESGQLEMEIPGQSTRLLNMAIHKVDVAMKAA